MKSQTCPQCGSEMDEGHVQIRPDVGSESSVMDCWFVSCQGEDWLVVPRWDRKEAYRCIQCGTTVILRGQ